MRDSEQPTNLPSGSVEHAQLVAWTVWISNDQPRAYDVEGCVNVHGIGVLEADDVDVVAVPEVPFHPLDPKVVGHLIVSQKRGRGRGKEGLVK